MQQEVVGLPNVTDTSLSNPDFIFFVDGSRYADESGKFHTGYAVVSPHETIVAKALPPHMSAQEAELTALNEALKLSKGQTANIYTDSRYAFGIVHDFGVLWRTRGFMTAAGTPIKHATLIRDILENVAQTQGVAVMRVPAHTRKDNMEAKGNEKADQAAKQAALGTPEKVNIVHKDASELFTDLQRFQEDSAQTDKETWEKMGAEKTNGMWTKDQKYCLPRVLYPRMAEAVHLPTHMSANGMTRLVTKVWIAPGFGKVAQLHCTSCPICLAHNPGQVVKTPRKHSPRPLYPFQRLQIDYIQLPRSGPYEYVLVCVDMFSGWPEAYPVKTATARATAKKLVMELVPRFGVPETIESDRGTHFTAEVMQNVMQMIGVEKTFHTPYHPQSSGKVERMNGTLKLKIQKTMEQTHRPWPECLPLALFSVRYTPTGKTKLSPFEILFGRPPNTGLYYPQVSTLNVDNLTSYTHLSCPLEN
ncbi:protein NYNRIN-like [Dendrobates tinctorius]|uniref:protein NYNRIN-like n=1 Tax=Dendrobates tinctorius TaxID=92724 RepID=UPI003CCA5325